jgi:hypothetical protein
VRDSRTLALAGRDVIREHWPGTEGGLRVVFALAKL